MNHFRKLEAFPSSVLISNKHEIMRRMSISIKVNHFIKMETIHSSMFILNTHKIMRKMSIPLGGPNQNVPF